MTNKLEERFSGCLLGLAVGDAIGFELQYDATHGKLWAPGQIVAEEVRTFEFGRPFGLERGQYTDDTQMALATAQCIAGLGRVEGNALAHELARLWTSQEIIGASRACTLSICYLLEGKTWDEMGMPPGDQGNCAAKRMAPVGLLHAGRPEGLLEDVQTASLVTHQDPVAIAGAAVIAATVALAASDGPVACDRLIACLQDLLADTNNGAFSDYLQRMPRWLAMDEVDAIRDIAPAGREGHFQASFIAPHVLPSVLASVYAALKTDWDLCEALALIYRAQGDVDSTGAMTGALVGAARGAAAVPERLRAGIKDHERVEAIAARLFRAVSGLA